MPKGLRVFSNVKFTQESENSFLMIIQVDLRHETLLQSEVPQKRKETISGTKSVHGYQTLYVPVTILNIKD